ncbi:MAG: multicopper oxidase family protein [Reyranellaceae bacterium]
MPETAVRFPSLPRRAVLGGAAALALPGRHAAAAGQKTLRVETFQLEVEGKAATRFRVVQPDGTWGLTLDEGERFDARLENRLSVPTLVHWHGLNPPWRQDGVPYVSAPPVPPGKEAFYGFPATPPGTRWMHSHFGLQEQNLLAAPLIIRETSAIRSGLQEVVVLLEDFAWRSPGEIFEQLRTAKPDMKPDMSARPDLNDVDYDAFLANHRTLADPQVVGVDKGSEIRLRLINGATSSNFVIDLGGLEGRLITVDGNPIEPITVRTLPLATAQRADVLVRLPNDGKAVAVLARCEGRTLQTGIILRPPGAAVSKVAGRAETAAPEITLAEELTLRAAQPLANRPVDRSIPVELTGAMMGYIWGMTVHGQGGEPATVAKGQRIELAMRNGTMMDHPMHLHGHSFQVTEIDGRQIAGAVRDTILVPPRSTVKVQFDADNPGLWAFHCHNLYHMAAGMFTTVVYDGFS